MPYDRTTFMAMTRCIWAAEFINVRQQTIVKQPLTFRNLHLQWRRTVVMVRL